MTPASFPAVRIPTVVIAAALTLAAPASAHSAESFYGVTEAGRLVRLHSDSPGAIRSARPITGMSESEHLVGIDRSPANGQLYGVGTASYLYRVDGRGTATRVSPGLFDVFVQGSSYGLAFEPGGARLRLVSNAEQNMRIDASSGRVVDGTPGSRSGVSGDQNLRYAPGDSGAGEDPNVGAAAYVGGRLYGIDAVRDTLVRSDAPSEGRLRTVGGLGVNAADPVGLTVGSDGRAWAAFRREGRREVELWRIDLAVGRATRGAKLPRIGSRPLGRGRDPIVGLTAAGRVADDRTAPRLRILSGRRIPVRRLMRGRGHALRVRCSEACLVTLRVYSGRRRLERVTRETYRAGTARLVIRLGRRARRIVRRARSVRYTLHARDAAGNGTRRARRRR